MPDSELIAVARGDRPAELVLADARIVNVFTGEVETGNVAIHGGHIAGVGDYRDAERVIDLGTTTKQFSHHISLVYICPIGRTHWMQQLQGFDSCYILISNIKILCDVTAQIQIL